MMRRVAFVVAMLIVVAALALRIWVQHKTGMAALGM